MDFFLRWKIILPGACRSPRFLESQSLNMFMSFSVLCFVLTFFISDGCFHICHVCLRVTMTSLIQGKITVICSRHIWIGHFLIYHTSKKGTLYVQICDKLYYMKHWLHIMLVCNNMNKVEISMHMTVFSKGFDMSFLSRVNNWTEISIYIVIVLWYRFNFQ